VKPETVQRAEEMLQHSFRNPDLLREALTHASVADSRLASNERMEFLGDAVLELVICEHLYHRFPNYLEGDLTKIKSAVVSGTTCAVVARESGLTALLHTGKGVAGQSMPASLAAAVYESVVAAIYLDGGLDAARQFVMRTLGPHIDAIASGVDSHNYKAVLQQYAQKNLKTAPVYELLDEKGPDHSKCFEVCVVLDGRRFSSAWGPNKKSAEQKAAMLALRELGIISGADAPRDTGHRHGPRS